MRKAFCLASLFLFAVVFCSLGNAQTVIYVSNQGNDTEACGPQQSPCQTIQYAIDKADNSTINLATENYTLSEPLQINSRSINITSTNSSITIISAPNGFVVVSNNSQVALEHLTVNTNKFAIQVANSNLSTERIYFNGNSYSENVISSNASNVALRNTYFYKGTPLVLQGSLLDLLDTTFFVDNVICQDVLSTGSSPFMNAVGGKFNFTFFMANNISFNNNPLLRFVNVSNVQLINFQSTFVNDVNRLIDATDSYLNIDSAMLWFVVASKPLFYVSYTDKQVENQVTLGVSVFSSNMPAFEQDLFTSNNVNLVLQKCGFYSFAQTAFLFDDAPLKLTVRSSTFNGNRQSVFSMVPSNKTQSTPAYVTFDQCWFQSSSATRGLAVNLDSVSTPVILTFSNNNPQNSNVTDSGAVIYIVNTNATVTSVNNYLTNITATNNGGFVYLSNINSFSDNGTTFSRTVASNGSVYYLNNISSEVNIEKSYFSNAWASSHGGVGYFSNVSVHIRGSTPNVCSAMYGGIFYLGQGASLDLATFLVSGNATKGGAIYAATGSSFNITNGQLYNNNATQGGLAYLERGSSGYSNNSNISTNKALVAGGSFYLEESSSLTLRYGYLQQSVAGTDGGAIWSQGSIRVTNVAFSNNVAGHRGGSIYSDRLNVSTTRNDSVFDSYFQQGVAQDGVDLYLSYTYLRYGGLTMYTVNNSIICDHSTLYTAPIFAQSRLTVSCKDCVTLGSSLCDTVAKKYFWYIVGGSIGGGLLLLIIVIIVVVKCRASRDSGYQTIQTDNYQTY